MTAPPGGIVPAVVDFSDPLAPRAPAFGDVYHARQGALLQARQVFLAGNGLPERWRGRPRFAVLETGFGLGHNFLATWAAWRDDPQRPARLHFISIEKHPLRPADLARVHSPAPLRPTPDRHERAPHEPAPAVPSDLPAALCAAWPPLAPGVHRCSFDDERVELLLIFGDVADALREVVASVDAFYLDGFAPDRNPEMWSERVFRSLARLAAPGATVATWSVAGRVRAGLESAGFDLRKAPGHGHKREILTGVHAPRVPLRRPAFRIAQAATRRVAVVGAGLAGAFAARALAREGLECLVFDAAATPASGASGNVAGLFHGVFHSGEGPHALALRLAAAFAREPYAQAVAAGVPGALDGLLRLTPGQPQAALAQALQASGLPPEVLQAWGPEQARRQGAAAEAGWFHRDGGWMSPAALVRWALDGPGIERRLGTAVASLQWTGAAGAAGAAGADAAPPARWRLLDAAGGVLAE